VEVSEAAEEVLVVEVDLEVVVEEAVVDLEVLHRAHLREWRQ
jgi:hypothetical protein